MMSDNAKDFHPDAVRVGGIVSVGELAMEIGL
jgi:hypothetical protein